MWNISLECVGKSKCVSIAIRYKSFNWLLWVVSRAKVDELSVAIANLATKCQGPNSSTQLSTILRRPPNQLQRKRDIFVFFKKQL